MSGRTRPRRPRFVAGQPHLPFIPINGFAPPENSVAQCTSPEKSLAQAILAAHLDRFTYVSGHALFIAPKMPTASDSIEALTCSPSCGVNRRSSGA